MIDPKIDTFTAACAALLDHDGTLDPQQQQAAAEACRFGATQLAARGWSQVLDGQPAPDPSVWSSPYLLLAAVAVLTVVLAVVAWRRPIGAADFDR